MRRPLVAGNWKLNGSRAANHALLSGIRGGLPPGIGCDVAVCPPFVYLSEVVSSVRETGIFVGGQNCSAESTGAFTGEVSAEMLREVGCSFIIVGHSERRTLFGETDELVARKFQGARRAGTLPILCLGETLREREAGTTAEVVRRQLTAVLSIVAIEEFRDSVIAYEPIWAIGTGHTASPEQAQEVHALIRSMIASRDDRIGEELRILYGGSVKGSNASALFAMPDIDGALVGGASLDAQDFTRICCAAGEGKQ